MKKILYLCVLALLLTLPQSATADESGITPLMEAALAGNLKAMQKLLQQKVDVNAQTDDGATATHLAARSGQKKALQLLVKNNANLKIETQNGETVLIAAVTGAHANAQTVQYIIDVTKDAEGKNKDGSTALMNAAMMGRRALMDVLIKNKANVNAQNNWGGTPLLFAASEEYNNDIYGTIEYLIKKGVDVNFKAPDSRTILEQVQYIQNEKLRQRLETLLKKYGAK